jgi:hypothetical protein
MLKCNLLLFTVAVFATGCGAGGPATAPVSGTVIYNGKPVPNAHVSFVPSDPSRRAAEGLTDTSGRFTLGTFSASDGAIVGKYKIGVIANGPPRPAKPGEGSGMPGETVPGEPSIPKKYFSPETSGLEHEVKSGRNSVELTLKD